MLTFLMLPQETCRKLIELVKARPALYDNTLIEYSNRAIVQKLWDEISEELHLPSAAFSWGDLLKAYSKFISGQGKTVTTMSYWLVDAMEFMRKYVGKAYVAPRSVPERIGNQDIKIINISSLNTSSIENTPSVEKEIEKCDFKNILPSTPLCLPPASGNLSSTSGGMLSTLLNQPPPPPCFLPTYKMAVSQQADTTNIEQTKPCVLPSFTAKFQNNIKESTDDQSLMRLESEKEHPILKFVDGILPDIKQLSEKRKRYFKQHILVSLHKLLDDQES